MNRPGSRREVVPLTNVAADYWLLSSLHDGKGYSVDRVDSLPIIVSRHDPQNCSLYRGGKVELEVVLDHWAEGVTETLEPKGWNSEGVAENLMHIYFSGMGVLYSLCTPGIHSWKLRLYQ